VALHIPWDRVDDFSVLVRMPPIGRAPRHGQRERVPGQRLHAGQRHQSDPGVRKKALTHLLECVDVMDVTGSRDLKLLVQRRHELPRTGFHRGPAGSSREALAQVYARLSGDQRLILEYKLFEPAFYTMDVPDWGTSYAHCLQLGERAKVCVDTGHHAPGTNIEFIVRCCCAPGSWARSNFQLALLRRRRPDGGRRRPVPAVPHTARGAARRRFDTSSEIAFMLDQCHNIEPKIPGQIRSVLNVQEATAKACSSTLRRWLLRRRAATCFGANAVLMDAYNTDVRPMLASLRADIGLDPDPMAAYAASGYAERMLPERVGGVQAGWAHDGSRRADRAVAPAGRRPAQPKLRRGQHLGQGIGARPGHWSGRRAAVGEGLGR